MIFPEKGRFRPKPFVTKLETTNYFNEGIYSNFRGGKIPPLPLRAPDPKLNTKFSAGLKRADLAKFMLNEASNNQFVRTPVTVVNG